MIIKIRRGAFAALVVLLTALASAVAMNAPVHAFDLQHTLMKGSPTSMGQTNGPVYASQIAGGRIFVGGGFTSTRPSGAAEGSNETGQGYLAAFDASTGAPVASFHPVLSNDYSTNPPIVRALALSPDKQTLYVGGDFNLVDGQRAEHIAAFDTATGAFKGMVGWNGVNGFVQAIAPSPDGQTLYVGGSFNKANWSTRHDLAAFNLADKSLRSWAPVIATPTKNEGLRVAALAVSEDNNRVFVAGPFQSVNGTPMQGFAATNAVDGSLVHGFSSSYLLAPYNWGTSLAVQDGVVYLGGRDDYSSTTSRKEGVYALDAASGAVKWYADCLGDTFAVLPLGDDVYVGSHSHDCSRNGGMPQTNPWTYLAIHALSKSTGQDRPYFVQTFGSTSRPDSLLLSRTLATDGSQMVMGGGYDKVDNTTQANLTRFGVGSAPPERAAWPTGSSCQGCNYTNLKILRGADRDDIKLTYEIYRNSATTNPIATIASDSFPYQTSTFTFKDIGLTPGQQIYYRVRALDPAGNAVWSVRSVTMTVGSGTTTTKTTAVATTDSTSTRTAPSLVPTTKAQKAAAAAAHEIGLLANGHQGKKHPAPATPAPVLDDRSVPKR